MAAQLLAHFTPLWTNYPLTLTPFYLFWQPISYIILPPLNKLPPHSFSILRPLAAELLAHFILSGKITPAFLHHFTPLAANSYIVLPLLNKLPPHFYTILPPLAAQRLPHYTPSVQFTPSILHHFNPLVSSTLSSFYPLCTNYPLTLTPLYPPCQPNSYITLPPLNKLPPHCYIILTPWQLNP